MPPPVDYSFLMYHRYLCLETGFLPEDFKTNRKGIDRTERRRLLASLKLEEDRVL